MITVRQAETAEEWEACFRIREAVFVTEQHVPPDLERDDDDAGALHFIAMEGVTPIGTGRAVLKDAGDTAKIGRVAVLPDHRGLGVGALLIGAREACPALHGVACFRLDAQTHAIPFYARLGYRTISGEFLDAGIPHCGMEKRRPGDRQEQ